MAHRQNPLADRWLLNPRTGAHVLVIGEHAPQVTLDALEQQVLAGGERSLQDFQLLARGVWQRRAGGGVLLKTRGQIQGQAFTYLYGLTVEGGDAFQVVGFAPAPAFAGVEDELLQVLRSFQTQQPRAAR